MFGPASVVTACCVLLQAASTPGWPASAGPRPEVSPTEFKDPRPDYFDPPAGRYRLPDGTLREADPPPGFYDPPPGHYTVVERGVAPAANAVIGPLPTADGALAAWFARRKRLRIGLGVSLGTIGVGAAVPLIGLAVQSGGGPCLDCFPPGALVALYVVPIGVIASIATGIALGVHARRRPGTRRVQILPGGLRMSF